MQWRAGVARVAFMHDEHGRHHTHANGNQTKIKVTLALMSFRLCSDHHTVHVIALVLHQYSCLGSSIKNMFLYQRRIKQETAVKPAVLVPARTLE